MGVFFSILFFFSSSRYSLQQSLENIESLELQDPLRVSTVASADLSFATVNPDDVGEVCVITTDDSGQSLSLTPSPALFKRMADEVKKSSTNKGNITAVDEILYDGYTNAVSKRLVTAGAVASFFSIVRKVIATAAVYFSAKALYDNPLHLPQPPALKITYTQQNLEDIEDSGPQVSDGKDLILLVSTVGSDGYETVYIPNDVVSATRKASATASTSATATNRANCPTGNDTVKCDDPLCLGVKNPVAKGKICTKDGPLKGCDCDYCIKKVEDQLVCSDQKRCKGTVAGDDSLAAQCTTGDQEGCDCKCGLADADAPMCDADEENCDPNKADICQKQTENTIGCECLGIGEAVVDSVDVKFVSFVSAVNSKLAKSETTGFAALTSLLPGLAVMDGNSMGQSPATTATGGKIKPTDPVVVCDAIKDLRAANWTAKYWSFDGNWTSEAVAADRGKDYSTLTGKNPWRYNNPEFLNDPIDQFCEKAIADMPKDGFKAGTVYNADKKPYNKYTLEEVQFRIETPNDGSTSIIQKDKCVKSLKSIPAKCRIFEDSDYAVWGGSTDADKLKWYILPQYLRQPAVNRPTAYARENYAPGRTTWEVHGAGWLTDDFGVGLYQPGGFQKKASNSGGHLYFTPSGVADPFGMEWWANGQFELKLPHIRKQWVEGGVSDHGGPENSIKWWNNKDPNKQVTWPKDWNNKYKVSCEGSVAGCEARSLVPKPNGPPPPRQRR